MFHCVSPEYGCEIIRKVNSYLSSALLNSRNPMRFLSWRTNIEKSVYIAVSVKTAVSLYFTYDEGERGRRPS